MGLGHPVVVHQHVEKSVASLEARIGCLAKAEELPEHDTESPNIGLSGKDPIANALNSKPLHWQRPVRFLLVVTRLVYILYVSCLYLVYILNGIF